MVEEDALTTFQDFSKEDIDNMCRVCLQDGVLKSVFADDEVPKLSQKIHECASVEVVKGDGLPENICDYCISELNLAYYFRNQCRLSDAKLRRAFQKKKTNNEQKLENNLNVVNNNETTVTNNEQLIVPNVVPMETEQIIPKKDPKQEPIMPSEAVSPEMILPVPNPRIEVVYVNENKCGAPEETIISDKFSEKPTVPEKPVENKIEPPQIPQTSLMEQLSQMIPESVLSQISKLPKLPPLLPGQMLPQLPPLLPGQMMPTLAPMLPQLKIENENGASNSSIQNKLKNIEKRFKCTHCDKAFIFLSRLRQHQATHAIERPYKCEICDKTFCRKDTLTSHITTHSKQKPFKCDKCVAHFTRRNSLNKHYYIHTNTKAYKCNLCMKSFGRRDNFNIHMKAHKGLRPFKCEQCQKAFVRSDVLIRHKKTHEEQTRKYICAICLKTYSRPDVLRTHLKQHVKKFEDQQ